MFRMRIADPAAQSTERRSLEFTEDPADCPQHLLVAFSLIWFPCYPENPGILSRS